MSGFRVAYRTYLEVKETLGMRRFGKLSRSSSFRTIVIIGFISG